MPWRYCARRAKHLMRVVLLVTVLLASACGSPTSSAVEQPAQQQAVQPPPDGTRGDLLFLRNAGLWTMPLQGQPSPTELVKPPEFGQVLGARWSPDGTRVAYAVYELLERRTPVSYVYVASADGSDAQRIVGSDQAGTFYQAPIWSPDGQQLYIQHTGNSPEGRIRRIARIDLATKELSTILEEVGHYDVSPDGRQLVIVRQTSGYPSLGIANIETGQGRTLVAAGPFEVISAPRFDPTSQTVLFSASRAVGSSPSSPPPLAVGLSLSTLLRTHGPPQDLYTVAADGGEPKLLAAVSADEPIGVWSPDGSQIAVLSTAYLAMMPADGATPRQLLTPGGYGAIDWSRRL